MKPFAFFLLTATLLALTGACTKNPDAEMVLSKYDMNRPVGFGADVTGGAGENVTEVTTARQLIDAVSGTRAATVYVKGEISLDATIPVGSNKSIIGLPGATISNLHRDENAGIFLLRDSDNVIIRNLTLKGPGAYDIDANYADNNISVTGSTRIWVDHCDIQDGNDYTYCIGYGVYCNIYVEKCAFTTASARR